MAFQIYAGSTSQSVRFFVQDTSVTTGAGLTGLTHSTSGLTAYYSKGNGAATAITLASQTATGAYTSGGFCAVDGTNMPGIYRLDLPDAVVDTEAEVIVMLQGAANMAPVAIRITARKLQANAVTVADKTGYSLTTAPPTAAAIADAVWDELHADHTTDGTYGDSVLIAANSNRTVQVTGSNHVAADIHELQVGVITAADFSADWFTAAGIASDAVTEIQSGLATAANQVILIDRVSYALTALVGACSDAQTAAETYTLSIGGNTYTLDYSGLDASGNRSTTTLTKA